MNPNDAKTEAAAGAALAAASPPTLAPLDPHDQDEPALFTVILRDGQEVETVDLEKYRYAPRDKRGHVHVHTPDALVAYAKRHLDDHESTLWADVEAARVTVVLNDHATDLAAVLAGWADHRAELVLRRSPEWKAWSEQNEKGMSQTAFAEFLEENVHVIADPDGATLLEVARTFHATKGARFKSAVSLHSGETQLVYEEQIEAKAGISGDTTVPRDFTVALRPFLGHEPVLVRGRFTYRVREGTLALGYKLLNLDDISRDAVMTIVTDVSARLDLPAIEGTAPGARR